MSFSLVNRTDFHSWRYVNVGFLIGNTIGIALYLMLASRGWTISEEHGAIPITGEPFVWALALPVAAVCFLLNAIWGALFLFFKVSKGRFWWLITAAAWLFTIVLDFAHH
jgi:hypothetical protein